MSCDVIWCVFILCDAISCVVWCHVMHCDVMWCPLMWWAVICCEVMRCNGMRSYEFVMRCGWLRCHVLWFEVVVWGELEDDLVIRTTQIYSVLHSTTKYYSSTTLYYTVLLCTTKYYSSTNSVLQSTTPVLLCTTKYYSSTSLYYKVLLQYYSILQSTTPVLQSTTPVLFCTTKYYSSTSLYYKVLLYSVLQTTTPVLVWTTKYYSSTTLYYTVLLCTTKYYSTTDSVLQSTTPVLLCTTQIYSSTTLYYKVLLQYYSVLQSTTPVLLLVLQSTHLQGAEHQRHQRHQMMCLPRKVTLMIDPRHIWNVSYNAQSNRTHPPTPPNTAPATQNDSHEWCPSHMKRHLQWAEQQVSSTNVTKYCACHEKWLASLILVTYETSFTMRGATGITLQPHQSNNYCTCHAKWLSWVMSVTYETSFTMRGATGITFQPHQILRLPRKIALQNLRKICRKQLKRQFQCAAVDHDPNPIRTWSDREIAKLNPSVRRAYFFPPRQRILFWKLQHFALRLSTQISANAAPATKNDTARSPNTATATKSDSHEWCPSHLKRHLQCAEQQDSSSNATKYCTCHATSLTLQPHQMLRLPRKMRRMIDPRDIWNVIYNARSNRHHLPTSPSACHAKLHSKI